MSGTYYKLKAYCPICDETLSEITIEGDNLMTMMEQQNACFKCGNLVAYIFKGRAKRQAY